MKQAIKLSYEVESTTDYTVKELKEYRKSKVETIVSDMRREGEVITKNFIPLCKIAETFNHRMKIETPYGEFYFYPTKEGDKN